MIPFRVRKLYVDLIARDGAVWIFYFLDVRSLFGREQLAAVEHYPREAPAAFVRATDRAAWPATADGRIGFRLNLPRGPLEFSGACALPPWHPAGAPDGLAWHVVAPRIAATLRTPEAAAPIAGTGYADFVEVTRLPRSLGLRRLHWGRRHAAEGTLVFTSVAARDTTWRRATQWDHAHELRAWDHFDLGENANGTTLRLDDREVRFPNRRTLRAAAAVDRDRFPRMIERLLYQLAMGRTRESRWADEAAIHESVRFGRE